MIPLTYAECRARFLRAAQTAGAAITSVPITARGPDDSVLHIDAAYVGPDAPRRAVLVMSGTHGIEGFAGSAIQSEALEAGPSGGGRCGLMFVHAVNPWGMAHWRRYNESNVDLNRNWHDFDTDAPPPNEPYAEVHDLLCPTGDVVPDGDDFLAGMQRFVSERGLPWVREAVSSGQYTHPDGLYYGGVRREESTRVVERLVVDRLAGVEQVLSIDLHTGHGEYGTSTVLSRAMPGSEGDRWVREVFDGLTVEATVANPDATLAAKVGQLGHGLVARLADLGAGHTTAVTLEIGTRSETYMIVVERAEHWVHRFGDPSDPAHRQVIWDHRHASIPDDPAWEAAALRHGREHLARAVAALG